MIIEHINKFDSSLLVKSKILCDAMDILLSTDFAPLKPGRYDVQGDALFYVVQEYSTQKRDKVEAEVHQKYCDVQFLVSGKEAIGWASSYTPIGGYDYDKENDIAFFPPPGNETLLLLEPGYFAFFAPYEIHRPRLEWEEGAVVPVKKVVVKIDSSKL